MKRLAQLVIIFALVDCTPAQRAAATADADKFVHAVETAAQYAGQCAPAVIQCGAAVAACMAPVK